ncbi:MAG: branched-chain amino acid ABC transporter permease [Hyphomicrobiaceae bacterium]|nr:branched-chain amino acid ABC transporter permease [Hyphomicrobiaceae bacterium]
MPTWLGVVLAVALLAAPVLLDSYYLHALITSMIFLLPAHGLNLIVGYTGMMSLAQGAFFGIGSYVSALLAMHLGTPFWVNFLAAGVVTGLIALPLGVPALRLRTYSFVMCTLGLVVIGETVAKNWISVTRGDMGLSGIPRPHLGFGVEVTTITGYYYLFLFLAVVMTALFWALVSSPAGRAMIAIRDNETQAEALGIPTWSYKLIVFALSAAFAGFGGSMFAHYLTTISPLTFQMYYSTTILIIVLGGGAGTIRGVVVGSLTFVAVSEALRIAPELRMIIYGFVLLLLVFWLPKGITPLVDKVFALARGRST